jgi:hypothetical protein
VVEHVHPCFHAVRAGDGAEHGLQKQNQRDVNESFIGWGQLTGAEQQHIAVVRDNPIDTALRIEPRQLGGCAARRSDPLEAKGLNHPLRCKSLYWVEL